MRGNKVKTILIIVIPIVVILCAVGGFLSWYFSPINRINRAFESEDYQTVVSLYGRLNEENAEDVQVRLFDIAQDYYKDYLAEKADYKETVEFFDLVLDEALADHRKAKKLRGEIDTIHQSREDYAHGVELMDSKQYLEAIECFNLVSELDEKYKSLADEAIDFCRGEYITELLAEVDSLIAAEDYQGAMDMVIAGLGQFPEDEQLMVKSDEIASLMYSDVEGTWTTTYDFGDLIAAEMGLSGYNLYFPAELVFEFDGTTMKMYVNEGSIEGALDAMCADKDSMDALYVVAEQYGVNKFEADLLVNFMYGGSYSAFLMDQYGTEISDALNSFKCESSYTADSKKIHLGSNTSNSYFNYVSIGGNSLELSSYTGSQDPICVLKYPISLIRKLR